jgi:hypothetical protein
MTPYVLVYRKVTRKDYFLIVITLKSRGKVTYTHTHTHTHTLLNPWKTQSKETAEILFLRP